MTVRERLNRLNPVQGGAARMRAVATGLLLVMAAVYATARAFQDVHPAVGYVRAFAEAAMVGGLADWFAVTALFRHPLGLPIPHTAIIPRNKDRIGDTLALFLRDNFLTARVVARRMARVDIAGSVGRFLTVRHEGDSRIRAGATRVAADVLAGLDPEKFGPMVKAAIVGRMRGLDVAPLLGQALSAAIAEGRHLPLLAAIVAWSDKALDHNEPVIREMIHARAGAIMRWTGLDETLSTAIVDGLKKILGEMAGDPAHPMRLKAEEGLAKLAADLQSDPRMRARVARFRDEILENPALRRWIDGLWESGRGALLRAVRDPRATLAGRFGEALRQLGETLQNDPAMRLALNRFSRRAVVGATASYGDSIVRLVSDTVRGWDADTITGRLENAVGRDLQYIRVNGTVVGGLVGVILHAIDVWL